jgi:hypothetical protein
MLQAEMLVTSKPFLPKLRQASKEEAHKYVIVTLNELTMQKCRLQGENIYKIVPRSGLHARDVFSNLAVEGEIL